MASSDCGGRAWDRAARAAAAPFCWATRDATSLAAQVWHPAWLHGPWMVVVLSKDRTVSAGEKGEKGDWSSEVTDGLVNLVLRGWMDAGLAMLMSVSFFSFWRDDGDDAGILTLVVDRRSAMRLCLGGCVGVWKVKGEEM